MTPPVPLARLPPRGDGASGRGNPVHGPRWIGLLRGHLNCTKATRAALSKHIACNLTFETFTMNKNITLLTALLAGAFASTPALADPEASMNKAGCMACHAKDKKMVGPSFKDIAAKYKGQDAIANLMDKVRKGGSGVYGPIPMAPNGPDKINDGDLKAAVEYILKS